MEKPTPKPPRVDKKAVLIPEKKAASKPKFAGNIAIVTDDWGYNRSHCQYLQKIDAPIAVAILPGQTYSRDIIQCSLAAGKEPMLHLPMEPHAYRESYPRAYFLTTDMSARTARKLLVKFLTEMEGVVGVNNHTGSRGTEDVQLVTTVLTELKKRRLFFLDSYTSERSVCGVVAKKLKMRIGLRDVFLDNRNERAAIEQQFASAVRIARKRGHVLMIGHDRALTLQIIDEQVKKLKAEGFEFLPVKEYIRRYEYSRD